MSLIKCEECGREISDKALSCPGCGCPRSIEETNAKKNHETVKVLKERVLLSHAIIEFILCFCLFLLLIIPMPVAYSINGEYSFINAILANHLEGLCAIYGLVIFAGYIFGLVSLKMSKISKILYSVGLCIFICLCLIIKYNQFAFTFIYAINILILAVLIFLPYKYKIKEVEEVSLGIEHKSKIEKGNKLIEQNMKAPYRTKKRTIILLVILGIITISTSCLFMLHNKFYIEAGDLNDINNSYYKDDKDMVILAKVVTDYVYLRSDHARNSNELGKVLKEEVYLINDIYNDGAFRWYLVTDKEGNAGYIANPVTGEKYLDVYYFSGNYELSKFSLAGQENKEKTTIEEKINTNNKSKKTTSTKKQTTNTKQNKATTNTNQMSASECQQKKSAISNEYNTTLNQRVSQYEQDQAEMGRKIQIAKEAMDIIGRLSYDEYQAQYAQATTDIERKLLKNRYNATVTYDKVISTNEQAKNKFAEWKQAYTNWYNSELAKLPC